VNRISKGIPPSGCIGAQLAQNACASIGPQAGEALFSAAGVTLCSSRRVSTASKQGW